MATTQISLTVFNDYFLPRNVVASNIVVSVDNSNLYMSSYGGDVTNATNIGGIGYGAFAQKVAGILEFKSFVPGSFIGISSDNTIIYISGTNVVLDAANVGSGQGLFTTNLNGTLQFESIAAGSYVSLTNDGSTITIDATNVVTGAANVGSGQGIFNINNAGSLEFESLLGGSYVSITSDGSTITINASNVVVGATNIAGPNSGAVFSSLSLDGALQLRNIAGGSYVDVRQDNTNIYIDVSSAINTTAQNLGAGVGLYATDIANVLYFKSIAAGSSFISVSSDNTTVTINATNVVVGATNIAGPNSGAVFNSISLDGALQLRNIAAGSYVSVNQDNTYVYINSTNVVVGAANVGSGQGLFNLNNAGTLEFQSLLGGSYVSLSSDGSTITVNASNVVVGATNIAGPNSGAVFSSLSLDGALQLRNIAAGTFVEVRQDNTNIYIDVSSGVYTTAQNLGAGVGLYATDIANVLYFKSVAAAGSFISVSSDNTTVTINATNVVVGAANVGSGQGIFNLNNAGTLEFQSLLGGSYVSLSSDGSTITVNASNVVVGATNIAGPNSGAVFSNLSLDGALQLRNIAGGSYVDVRQDNTNIYIDVSSAINTTAQNLGAGVGLYATDIANVLYFKSIAAGSSFISVSSDNTTVTINATNVVVGAANVGSGQGLFNLNNAGTLEFQSLLGGSYVSLSSDGSTITVNATNVVVGATNIAGPNSGAVFSSLSLDGALQLRNIAAGSYVDVRQDNTNIYIDVSSAINTTAQNLGAGVGLYATDIANVLYFKSIAAGSSFISVSSDNTTVTINATNVVVGAANVGSGQGIFNLNNAGTLEFQSLLGGSYVSLSSDGSTITIDATNVVIGATNIAGPNSGAVFSNLSLDGALQLRNIAGGSYVDVRQDNTNIYIDVSSAINTTAQNLGAGVGLYATDIANVLYFKSIAAGSSFISVSSDNTTVTINATNVVVGAANVGSGQGIFNLNNAGTLEFQSLLGGSYVSLSSDGSTITVNATNVVVGATNIAGPNSGAVFSSLSLDGALQLRNIAGGSYVDVRQDNTNIYIDVSSAINTTAQNLGAGVGLYATDIANVLYFKSIAAGSSFISVSSDNTTVTINATNVVVGAANVGSGQGIFNLNNAGTLEFQSLLGGSYVSLSSDGSTITVNASNVVVGATNIAGPNSGAVFSSLSLDGALQLRNIAGGSYVDVRQDNTNIYIDVSSAINTTAQNLGAGVGLYATDIANVLYFKSIAAGSSFISVSSDNTTVTINATNVVVGAANVGSGQGIFNLNNAGTLEFQSLLGGSYVSLSSDGSTITVNASNVVVGATNIAGPNSGAVFSSLSLDGALQLRNIAGGSYVDVRQDNTNIYIDVSSAINTTAQNLGAGVGLYATDIANVLYFKSIAAGSSFISVSFDNTTVTINATNVVVGAANVGSGQGIFNINNAGTLEFQSLLGGSYVSFTSNGSTITVNSTNVVIGATNVGSGSQVFNINDNGVLEFKSIQGGTNISVTDDGTTITVSSQTTNDAVVFGTCNDIGNDAVGIDYLRFDGSPATNQPHTPLLLNKPITLTGMSASLHSLFTPISISATQTMIFTIGFIAAGLAPNSSNFTAYPGAPHLSWTSAQDGTFAVSYNTNLNIACAFGDRVYVQAQGAANVTGLTFGVDWSLWYKTS
jgi:hypothetical protein